MKNIIYNLIGGISLSLGILGVFLPLLPSTCFVLLATWAFAKSSPRFHAWLYFKSPFANSIQNWQQHRMIPYKVKWIASLSLSVSFILTAILIQQPTVLIGIGIGMAALLAYLFSRPSYRATSKNTTFSRAQELHRQAI